MTREHKLALIVGFALVLAVAILISDHFSGASRAQGGGVIADNTRLTPDGSLAGPGGREIAFDLPGALELEQQQNPATPNLGTPEPERLASAEQGRSVLDSLADSVKTALNDLSNGHTPPLALQTETIRMGEPIDQPAQTPKAADRPEVDLRDIKRHSVASGDSLWGIAAKYYGDGHLYKNLAAYNADRVGEGGAVHPGATILIPPKHILLAGSVPVTDPRPAGTTPKQADTREYTVKSGDTLGEIAKRELGSAKRWREIVELNKDVIDDPDNVAAGTKIKLPKKS